MQKELLAIAAGVECLAGLAFFLVPGITVALLVGTAPGNVALMIGRVAGVALFSLGIGCWGARQDAGGAARMATLRAITLYNAGVALLLVAFAVTGQARGLIVWIAGLFHLGLALAFAASLYVAAVNGTVRSPR